jgi:Uma2 family endonuclease
VFSAIAWDDYVAIGKHLPDRPALRMTYAEGTLEIMTTSHEHEAWKKRLNRLLELLLDELEIAFTSAGNMTFQREDIERGIEPDDCYWIAHERQMRDHDDYDVKRDPPPDLAIEIEYSRGVINRLAVFAAIGIPEVWRFDGNTLTVMVLEGDGYVERQISPAVPTIPVQGIVQFMKPDAKMSSLKRKRVFLRWVLEQLSKRKRGKAK